MNLQLNNINVEFAKLFTTPILNIESLEMINQTNRKKPYDENEIKAICKFLPNVGSFSFIKNPITDENLIQLLP